MTLSKYLRSLILVSPLTLTACVTGLGAIDSGPRQLMATGLLAGEFGSGLDKAAKRHALDAEIEALESGNAGASTSWKSGKEYSGEVTPGQPFEVSGRICRRYNHRIKVDGLSRSADATACRNQEGLWEPLV